MSPDVGRSLGVYEVVAPLGAGGIDPRQPETAAMIARRLRRSTDEVRTVLDGAGCQETEIIASGELDVAENGAVLGWELEAPGLGRNGPRGTQRGDERHHRQQLGAGLAIHPPMVA